MGLFYGFVKATGWLPSLFMRRKIYYQNRTKQGRRIKGPAIIVSNHKRMLDFPLMMYTFCGRHLRTLTSEAVYQQGKLCSWFVKRMGNIRVNRPEYDFSFVAKSLEVLSKGKVLLVFPEGKLPEPGQEGLGEFKPSAAYIALQSGVPIIPVYNDGKYFKKKVSVIVGESFLASDFFDSAKSEDENIALVTQKIYEKVEQLGVELGERTKKKEK